VQEEEQAEKSLKSTLKKSTSATPKRVAKTANIKAESASQMQIVNEILKKNPDLLKDNKVKFCPVFIAPIFSVACIINVLRP
jgi:hypothetical protein